MPFLWALPKCLNRYRITQVQVKNRHPKVSVRATIGWEAVSEDKPWLRFVCAETKANTLLALLPWLRQVSLRSPSNHATTKLEEFAKVLCFFWFQPKVSTNLFEYLYIHCLPVSPERQWQTERHGLRILLKSLIVKVLLIR